MLVSHGRSYTRAGFFHLQFGISSSIDIPRLHSARFGGAFKLKYFDEWLKSAGTACDVNHGTRNAILISSLAKMCAQS